MRGCFFEQLSGIGSFCFRFLSRLCPLDLSTSQFAFRRACVSGGSGVSHVSTQTRAVIVSRFDVTRARNQNIVNARATDKESAISVSPLPLPAGFLTCHGPVAWISNVNVMIGINMALFLASLSLE